MTGQQAGTIAMPFGGSWATSRFGVSQKGSTYFRRKRFALFLGLVDEILARQPSCRILDIGGELGYWANVADMMGTRACAITMLNLTPPEGDTGPFSYITGDARNLSSVDDMSYDLVHSNSVIEHVGGWGDMLAMAREVRRVAPAYYVQTPYFWFPMEPHCSTLFFHWLPKPVRLAMLLRKPRGHWGQASDVTKAMETIESADLIDCRMMATLYPDATIQRERVMGLTKSLIAVRKA